MIVSTLSLSHFRNYEQVLIEPDAGVTVFTGPNAQGKTNILEALHVCCLGRSHRTARDEEMIQWGQENARILVRTRQADGTHEVSILLSRTQKKKKTVRIGARQAERIGELLGHVCGGKNGFWMEPRPSRGSQRDFWGKRKNPVKTEKNGVMQNLSTTVHKLSTKPQRLWTTLLIT